MITIGIDPHKSSLTAVALGPTGTELGQIRLRVSGNLGQQLLGFVQTWPKRQWAVEGATGLGRGVAQLLAAADQQVLSGYDARSAGAPQLRTGTADTSRPGPEVSQS